MKFVFFNLYYFTQVNLNGIFHVYGVYSGCVCVRVCERRLRQRERKALLICLADSHRCYLTCAKWVNKEKQILLVCFEGQPALLILLKTEYMSLSSQ